MVFLYAGLATFLLFSLSRFQLPHYLNIVFPFFAIITADYLFRLEKKKTLNLFSGIHFGMAVLLMLLTLGLYFIFLPASANWWALLIIAICFLLAFLIPVVLGTVKKPSQEQT